MTTLDEARARAKQYGCYIVRGYHKKKGEVFILYRRNGDAKGTKLGFRSSIAGICELVKNVCKPLQLQKD